MTSWTWRCTAAKSTSGSAGRTPNGALARRAYAMCAAAIRLFDGTQPVFRQSPPILSASISTVRRPSWAAPEATDSPAEPPPITQMSASMRSLMAGQVRRRPDHGK